TGWYNHVAPNPYRGSVVTSDTNNNQQLLSEGSYIGPGANSMVLGGSGGATAFVGCVYEPGSPASPGHITAVSSNGVQSYLSPPNGGTNYFDDVDGMTIWHPSGSGD